MRCAEQGKVGETVLFSNSAIIHSLRVKKLPDWHGLTRRGVERREQVSPQRQNKTVFSQKNSYRKKAQIRLMKCF